jgi:hypothetical protein
MDISSATHPHNVCTGLENVASNVNDVNTISTIINSFSFDSFLSEQQKQGGTNNSPVKKIASGKSEKLCRSFSPFDGTWDYSEVD